MIWRLAERACRRGARRMLRAGRAALLHASHPRFRRTGEPRAGRPGLILAIRLDRLGDLVLTLPAIDDLASAYPSSRLVAVVRSGLAPLLKGRPSLSTVMEVPAGQDVVALASRLSIFGAGLAVVFSSVDDLLVPRATALAGIPERIGFAGAGREVFLTRAVRPPLDAVSFAEGHALLVAAAGGSPSNRRPSIIPPAEEAREAEVMLRTMGAPPGAPRIAVHPGGSFKTQRWPASRFAAAARGIMSRRGGKAVVLAGPGEEDLAREIKRELHGDCLVLPPGDVGTLAAVLSRCDLLIANNSGPLHLAGALRVPTVSLMGPTDPVRFWPQGIHQVVLRKADLPCSPCSRGRCAPHECLLSFGPEEVTERALDLLDPVEEAASCVGSGERRLLRSGCP